MKTNYLLTICLACTSLLVGQNNLELLYQWTDDGTVLNIEDNPGDNWVGNV